MSNLSDFIKSQLERRAQSFECRKVGDSDVFTFCSSGKNTGMNCCVRVREQTRGLCISIGNGVRCPARRRPQAYELIARLNAGMAIGQYWIDCLDGEITFSVTASLLEIEPTDMWFGSLVHTGFCTFDRHFPAIADVFFGNKKPVDALNAEKKPSNEEVTQSLEKLFSNVQGEQQTTERAADGGEAKGDNAPAGDGSKRRAARRDVTPKITPGEIEEVMNDQRRKRKPRGKPDDSE